MEIANSCYHRFIDFTTAYAIQLVKLTFGYRKRNQKKLRRLRRQGVKI